MIGHSADLAALLRADPVDLARAALLVARVEFPRLEPHAALRQLDAIAARACARLGRLAGAPTRERVLELNRLLYVDEGFQGNRTAYDDFRNSLLNVVLERRLGIPISLAVVYLTVARRAGLDVHGVSFPGHFLLRVMVPEEARDVEPLILDPFDGGRILDDRARRRLFDGSGGAPAAYGPALLAACSSSALIARMLNNLKLIYVNLRSFPQALAATSLLLDIDPSLDSDLRDRGLLAYHVHAYPQALQDLEDYLRRSSHAPDEDTEERDQIWERVSGLRRRLASMN